jgi:hypothetical protein
LVLRSRSRMGQDVIIQEIPGGGDAGEHLPGASWRRLSCPTSA